MKASLVGCAAHRAVLYEDGVEKSVDPYLLLADDGVVAVRVPVKPDRRSVILDALSEELLFSRDLSVELLLRVCLLLREDRRLLLLAAILVFFPLSTTRCSS